MLVIGANSANPQETKSQNKINHKPNLQGELLQQKFTRKTNHPK